MAINHFFDKSVIIRRLKVSLGTKRDFVATATIDMHIQSISDSKDMDYYAAYGAQYKAWVDPSSVIRKGDRVTDSNGNIYDVVKINKKEYSFAMNIHQEVFLKAKNE